MKKLVMIIMAVALFALPAMAQNMEFRSTSTMQSSGNYVAPVTAVGAVTVTEMATTTESYSPASGPRRAKMGDFDDSPEGGEGSGDSPIGDAVLPLMLMAMLFAGVVYTRRKKQAAKS